MTTAQKLIMEDRRTNVCEIAEFKGIPKAAVLGTQF